MSATLSHELYNRLAPVLDALDFSALRVKLIDEVNGEGWSEERAARSERRYRRFLFLCATGIDHPVPTKDIDTVWHYHLLRSRDYARDCDAIFEQFLHHSPDFGSGGTEDRERLLAAFDRTRRAYEEFFGEPYLEDGQSPTDCSSCGGGCST